MISVRLGVAVALLIAVAAGIGAFAALLAAFRSDTPGAGRLVQTRMSNSYGGAPIAFPLDDFYMSKGSDGRMHALYAYPSGFYGHARGCKVGLDPGGRRGDAVRACRAGAVRRPVQRRPLRPGRKPGEGTCGPRPR